MVRLDAEIAAGWNRETRTRDILRQRRKLPRRGKGRWDHGRLRQRPGEWREDRVGRVGLRPQAAGGEERLSVVELESIAERGGDAEIPLAGQGFDFPMGYHPIRPPFPGETRNDVCGVALDDEETGATFRQARLEAPQAIEEKLHVMGTLPRSLWREDAGIENEERDHLAAVQRTAEWLVVRDAEVLAAEPDEGPHLGSPSDAAPEAEPAKLPGARWPRRTGRRRPAPEVIVPASKVVISLPCDSVLAVLVDYMITNRSNRTISKQSCKIADSPPPRPPPWPPLPRRP